jgi:hypothetical protein
MTDTSYNKHTTTRNGTLIANWQEERALKEFSGEARYVEFQTLYFYFDGCKDIVSKLCNQYDKPAAVSPKLLDCVTLLNWSLSSVSFK